MPYLSLAYDIRWPPRTTDADGSCLADSLAACSQRLKTIFKIMEWPWNPAVPVTKQEWRACICRYILQHQAAFRYIRNAIWADPSKPVRVIVGELQQQHTWMQYQLLHIAAWFFARLTIPGRFFDDGQPAHVRVWYLTTRNTIDAHLNLMPPSNLDGWHDPGIPERRPLEEEARRRYRQDLNRTRDELHARILHYARVRGGGPT